MRLRSCLISKMLAAFSSPCLCSSYGRRPLRSPATPTTLEGRVRLKIQCSVENSQKKTSRMCPGRRTKPCWVAGNWYWPRCWSPHLELRLRECPETPKRPIRTRYAGSEMFWPSSCHTQSLAALIVLGVCTSSPRAAGSLHPPVLVLWCRLKHGTNCRSGCGGRGSRAYTRTTCW